MYLVPFCTDCGVSTADSRFIKTLVKLCGQHKMLFAASVTALDTGSHADSDFCLTQAHTQTWISVPGSTPPRIGDTLRVAHLRLGRVTRNRAWALVPAGCGELVPAGCGVLEGGASEAAGPAEEPSLAPPLGALEPTRFKRAVTASKEP